MEPNNTFIFITFPMDETLEKGPEETLNPQSVLARSSGKALQRSPDNKMD